MSAATHAWDDDAVPASGAVDLAKLLAPRADTATGLPEDDVEVPHMGTVRVRGLSREEVFECQKAKGTQAHERKILHLGMIDPAMTESQAAVWQKVSPAAEIEPVVDKIRELSGLDEGADKSELSRDGGAPGNRVRDVPGGATGDDGGPDAPGNGE
jgi:hypothetical protein